MGLMDAREDLSRTGVKFSRPKIERVFTAGPGNNIALELFPDTSSISIRQMLPQSASMYLPVTVIDVRNEFRVSSSS